jgi:hypothetical protein
LIEIVHHHHPKCIGVCWAIIGRVAPADRAMVG